MRDEYADLEYDRQRVEASRGVLELAVRQLRAFARFVTVDHRQADDLVEDTLLLFLADDRLLCDTGMCFGELLNVFRRAHARAIVTDTDGISAGGPYAAMLKLTVPEREIAALCISAGLSLEQAALLLNLCPEEAGQLMTSSHSALEADTLPDWPLSPVSIAPEIQS